MGGKRDENEPTQYSREALSVVEHEAGGRQQLVADTAAIADLLDPKYQKLAQLLADPRNDRKSLARLCNEAKVPVRGFLSLLRDTKLARAQLAASTRIADRLPEVAEDVMVRATTHYVTCSTCGGHKTVLHTALADGELRTELVECGICRGSGQVVAEPSHDVQKTALEIGGLIKKGGGIQIGVQQNAGVRGGSGVVSMGTTVSFREATDKLLFPTQRRDEDDEDDAVDAEYVEAEVGDDA